MAGVPLVAPVSNYAAPVHIDVGGTNYTSCLETLTKFPQSKLAKLFNGTLPIAVDPIKQQYFLDRDGKVFRHILNYLRNGELTLPDHFTDTNLLLKEATFFDLKELCKALTSSTTEPVEEEVETEQSDGEISSEETERQRQPGRRGRKRRKKKKHRDQSEEPQGQSTAAAEHRLGVVLPVDLHEECNEVIGVVTDHKGSVMRLFCSDQQFQVELPKTESDSSICLTGQKPSHLYQCSIIEVPNMYKDRNRLGREYWIDFPWLAKHLYQKGYRLITSCALESSRDDVLGTSYGSNNKIGFIYHNFVK